MENNKQKEYNEHVEADSDMDNVENSEEMQKYKQQIVDYFQSLNAENPELLLDYLQSSYTTNVPSIDRPEKILICPHEIVITVIANVLEENEKGETIGSKDICQKNYHIPVPATHDYNEYMNAFFSHLENCIEQSAKNATNNSELKTNE